MSTIVDADHIVVLDDGRVVGTGHARRAPRDLPDLPEIVESQRSARRWRHERGSQDRGGEGAPRPGAGRRRPAAGRPHMQIGHADREVAELRARPPSACCGLLRPERFIVLTVVLPSPSAASCSARSARRSSAAPPT